MKSLAVKNASAIAAGHTFFLIFGEGFFPLNVLNAIKMVPEVCRIFCATANPTEVIIGKNISKPYHMNVYSESTAQSAQGRGIMGVIDGFSPKGVEGPNDVQNRKDFLRKIGYKS